MQKRIEGPEERARRAARTASERALLEAEVRRLTHAIAPFGVLRRDVLARECHASRWRPGDFDGALEAAVREGRLRRLGVGFYGSQRDLGSGR
jgi:hypothetical protein